MKQELFHTAAMERSSVVEKAHNLLNRGLVEEIVKLGPSAVPTLVSAMSCKTTAYTAACALDLMASRLRVHEQRLLLPDEVWDRTNLILIGVDIELQKNKELFKSVLQIIDRYAAKHDERVEAEDLATAEQ